jgi:DNA-binding NarL/FixJ family response regulator
MSRNNLSPDPSRELQVLERIHAGFTNAEIGQALHLGVETVRKSVRSILSKLQVANRAEAAGRYARLTLSR